MAATFAEGNITTGKLAARYGSDIIGKVGFFYKKNRPGVSALEPHNVDVLVKVTGFYSSNGITVYTFSNAKGVQGGFTRVADVSFAAYADQADAAAVLEARAAEYRELMNTYHTAQTQADKDALREGLEALTKV